MSRADIALAGAALAAFALCCWLAYAPPCWGCWP